MSKPILHLFWIAEYQDGQALPQFNPDTGAEHLFKEVDHSKLKRFGWYAFPRNLANKVAYAAHNPCLTSYTVDIPPGATLVAHRTTSITFKPPSQSEGLSVEHHEADEYVLGLQGPVLGLVPRMHIYSNGRVELKGLVLDLSFDCVKDEVQGNQT